MFLSAAQLAIDATVVSPVTRAGMPPWAPPRCESPTPTPGRRERKVGAALVRPPRSYGRWWLPHFMPRMLVVLTLTACSLGKGCMFQFKWRRMNFQRFHCQLPVIVRFPGLVNGLPPRPADRLCVELIRSILHTFGLVICNPVDVPTHRRGAAFASPNLVQSVEVHDGASCHCVDRRRCCSQVGSDHFALTVTLRCNVKSTVSPPRKTLQVRSWPELLQSQYHKIQHWVHLEVINTATQLRRIDVRMVQWGKRLLTWRRGAPTAARLVGC